MDEADNKVVIPEETVISKIYLIRGKRVMLDMDLADIYGVETKQLKRAVKRNIERFPEDFMFEMTKEELQNWRSQFGTSNREKMGLRIPPFVFTDYGVLMLSSVLNSHRAVQANMLIIRVFAKMREMLLTHKELFLEIEQVKNQLTDHDNKFLLIFEYLKQFEQAKQQQLEQENRKQIGYKAPGKK
ncbi:MAG: ORF6N domain-containing protein [Bacteroidetes bacterium]|nr:ORF6N domain-containing protein [Bacteroidota bacterium]